MSDSFAQLEQHARTADPLPAARASASSSLLPLIPSRFQVDFQKLRAAVRRHRVIFMPRGAVIAITTLVSVGGGVAIFGLFVALLLLGALFPLPAFREVGKTYRGDPDSGGAPKAFAVETPDPGDDSPASGFGVPSAPAPAVENFSALAPLPALPAASAAVPPSIPELAASPLPLPEFARPEPRETARPALPADVAARIAAAQAATARDAVTALGRGNPSAPNVAFGGFDDEPVLGTGRGGGSGSGRGSGNGRGSGIDRGLSAANRPAAILNSADASRDLELPLKYQLKPPERPVFLLIDLREDGSIARVTVASSCGIPELDEMVREYALYNLKFSPAIRERKAVPSTFEYGHAFRPFD